MPIIRRVIAFGDSKAVTLPKSWIEEIERRTGQKIRELALEVNGSILVSPIFEKQEVKENEQNPDNP